DRLDGPNRICPDGKRAGWRFVERQLSFDIGLDVADERGRLDPHEHASGARLGHGNLLEREPPAEPFETPRLHCWSPRFVSDARDLTAKPQRRQSRARQTIRVRGSKPRPRRGLGPGTGRSRLRFRLSTRGGLSGRPVLGSSRDEIGQARKAVEQRPLVGDPAVDDRRVTAAGWRGGAYENRPSAQRPFPESRRRPLAAAAHSRPFADANGDGPNADDPAGWPKSSRYRCGRLLTRCLCDPLPDTRPVRDLTRPLSALG